MAPLTILCVSTVCIMVPADNIFDVAKEKVDTLYLEKSIRLTVDKFNYFKNRLKLTHEGDLIEFMNHIMQNGVFKNINPALDSIREAVELAKHEGRNSTYCYDIAYRILTDKATTQFKEDILPCINAFNINVTNMFSSFEPVSESLSDIESRLNDILGNCDNSVDIDDCLDKRIPSLRKKFEKLKKTVDYMITEEETSYQTWVEDFDKCLSNPADTYVGIADNVKRDGITCAENSGTYTGPT